MIAHADAPTPPACVVAQVHKRAARGKIKLKVGSKSLTFVQGGVTTILSKKSAGSG